VRIWQQFNAQRFIGGSIQSDFQWGTIDKILSPWRAFFDNIRPGGTAPGPRSPMSRLASVPSQGMEALGRTSFIAGSADYFTRIAWILNMVNLEADTARFLRPGKRLAEKLRGPDGQRLRTINREAREAYAVRHTVDETDIAAIRAGNKAEFKQWKKLVRDAGFGPRWDVARRFSEHGMLDPEIIDLILEGGTAMGALREGRVLPMLDSQRLSKYGDQLSGERAEKYQDAMNRLINSYEDILRKRVSEQQILQTPTNEASRTYHGRVLNAMTSFSRAFFDNNVLDMAGMPSRQASGMMTAFLLGESMNQMARRMWQGEDLDDLMQEWNDDPARTGMRYAMNLPLLGQSNWILRAATEPLVTGNNHRQAYNQGAAVSVANNLLNFAFDATLTPFSEDARENVGRDAQRYARRLVPALNSHYGGLITVGLEEAFDTRLRPEPPKRGGSSHDPRPDPFPFENLPNGEFGDILPAQDNIPDDLSFLIPEETRGDN
jgi:hypothetical protein